ncbi:MAG TPA: bifunctional phosphoribosylaminoimidazolecarboxamide formyltransferase/IMP cyclohydrolase, partial [Myxococcota bacterium]|nr:bifunctional phosphoribosylaminoimidazolecarboxamide formyltransferase/IMP cyclohydrolase [Myxococcota bacterium]
SKTNCDLIENIDIGGPSMLRAAAKNHHHVVALYSQDQYGLLIEHYGKNLGTTLAFRQALAESTFYYSSSYDRNIANTFAERFSQKTAPLTLDLTPLTALRYGENPHQQASLFGMEQNKMRVSIPARSLTHQKELSYNNFLDTHAAIWALRCLCDQRSVAYASVVIKHGVPCGAASATSLTEAIRKAIASDETSAFGGVFAVSAPFEEDCVEIVEKRFIELIVAPSFSDQALAKLAHKKNLQLLAIDNLMSGTLDEMSYKSIFGGMLRQSQDHAADHPSEWSVVTKTRPSPSQFLAMEFAFRLAKATPSNGITIASPDQLFGVGAGQPSRIQSAKLALDGAKSRSFNLALAAMASDGFFPFGDSIELAHHHGLRAVIQPGGSIRDQEVIDQANQYGMTMVFTHRRHFRH